MPVGQWFELHLSAWMQPSANIIERAVLHKSAPVASMRTSAKPEYTLPATMSLTWSRKLQPMSIELMNLSPSRAGMPRLSWNSAGAAPVPPSPPSMVMKSGTVPLSIIAWQSAANSSGRPTHILKPMGLPPESSRSCATNFMSPAGEEKALWRGGELQSDHGGGPRPRASAMTGVILLAGRMPPCDGLAPCESLISIILISGRVAFFAKSSGSNSRCPLKAGGSTFLPQAK
mmetsp:Transcript_24863/g.80295  ORF Transcript_24863/g.80295 Transcript_24863/m.80295 type:complete len:231 (-) Transcript_24863:937-1629(-)